MNPYLNFYSVIYYLSQIQWEQLHRLSNMLFQFLKKRMEKPLSIGLLILRRNLLKHLMMAYSPLKTFTKKLLRILLNKGVWDGLSGIRKETRKHKKLNLITMNKF